MILTFVGIEEERQTVNRASSTIGFIIMKSNMYSIMYSIIWYYKVLG